MGKAIIIKGADFSQVAVGQIDIVVGQPTIAITIAGQVSISSASGDDIYYTTDGSTPTTASTKYTSAFNVQPNTTVKAVCYNGSNYSDVVTKLYDGTLQAPNISITNKGVVTISATDGASIRYTTNGNDPTASSGTAYTEPFTVEDGVVVKAVAYITSGGSTITSSVASETAVVPEGITFGKRISTTDGSMIDDAERFVTPKIPIADAAYVWYSVDVDHGVDICCEYDQYNVMTGWSNIGGNGTHAKGSKQRTPNAGKNTTYVRFSGRIGSSVGSYISQGGATLWKYDGSTE